MRIYSGLMLVVAGTLLSGCATGKYETICDTVGPSPRRPTAEISTNGFLVVYSAYEVNASFDNRDPRSPAYSDYRILTADGKLLQRVHNNSGTILQEPEAVELPPGKYQVIAPANGYGQIKIPVSVEARRITILHLEGDGFWPDESALNRTNAVRLPDGVVIGWKASPGLQSLNQ